MKKYILIIIILFSFIVSQTYEDVVILKNGSQIHGIIIEEKPNEYIKIKSGRNIFVYQMNEIELFKKEILSEEKEKKSRIFDKNRSLAVGIGTNRSLSLVSISQDFKMTQNSSFFLTAGIGSAIIGTGVAYQNNYNNNGIQISTTFGLSTPSIWISWHTTLNYQWYINDNSFISFGVMGGLDWDENIESLPYISPTVSYDYRF